MVNIPIDHERLPANSEARELRVGDIQFWGDHFIQVKKTSWSKSGKMYEVFFQDICDNLHYTGAPNPRWRHRCHEQEFNWGRRPRARAGRAIYRPVAVIHEDPF